MNVPLSIAVIVFCGSMYASAQKVEEKEPQPDPVLEAIREFNRRDKSKPNEVSVVLDPVGVPPGTDAPPPAVDDAAAKAKGPVLVTGKPPEAAVQDAVAEPPVQEGAAAEPEPAKPAQGLAVRVEKLKTGSESVDPSQIKLLAPFPAKPLSQPPAGWRLEASDTAPPFTRKVEIAPGSEITLTVRPHRLVPDSDGAGVFNISEPGYDASLGYGQTATVGAILSNSIRQLDEQSKQMGTAIDSLQQLLISLPKTESQPEVKSTPVRKK